MTKQIYHNWYNPFASVKVLVNPENTYDILPAKTKNHTKCWHPFLHNMKIRLSAVQFCKPYSVNTKL